MSGDDYSGDADALMTRRAYYVFKILLRSMDDEQPTTIFMAQEAVASTAIEHPEWDMEELRTWAEWEKVDGARLV